MIRFNFLCKDHVSLILGNDRFDERLTHSPGRDPTIGFPYKGILCRRLLAHYSVARGNSLNGILVRLWNNIHGSLLNLAEDSR